MTPAPKDAPVEPDFAVLATDHMKRNRWPAELIPDYCNWVADAMEEAFAAGRQAAPQSVWSEQAQAWTPQGSKVQAAPQPEGGPTGERERKAYRYLERLFNSVAPQCQPLPTLMGLCSQIDNYIAGYRQHCAALEAALRECAMLYPLKMPHEKAINYERLAREFNRRQKLAAGALTTAGAGKIGHFSILEDGPGRFVLCDDRTDDPAPVYATREEAERAARAGKGEG